MKIKNIQMYLLAISAKVQKFTWRSSDMVPISTE